MEAELLKVEENCAVEELRVDDLGPRDRTCEWLKLIYIIIMCIYIYVYHSIYTLYIILKPLELDR